MSHNSGEFQDELAAIQAKLADLEEIFQMNEVLSNQCVDRFLANIEAFRNYVPTVAEQFENYKQKDLKVIATKSGDANVLDPMTKIWLYGDNPRADCKAQVDKTFNDPIYTNISFKDNDVDNNFLHSFYLDKMYKNYISIHQPDKLLKRKISHNNALIVFGVGLGYHLEYITKDCTFQHIYICEPNSDFFFASLLFCDWVQVLESINRSGGYISFNIGSQIESFASEYLAEMRLKGPFYATNSLVFHHYPSIEIAGIINKLSMDFHLVAAGWGFFDDGVISIAHDYHNHLKGIPLLKRATPINQMVKNTPIFICANGPSLDYSISTIKENIDNAVVFSCGTALRPLLKNGIVPDFHIEVERTYATTDWLINSIPKEQLANLNLLTTNIMQSDIFELFSWSGIAFKPLEPGSIISGFFLEQSKFAQDIFFCGPIVANTACSYASFLGFEELYLFGVDNGYKSPKYHHSKDSNYYQSGDDKPELTELIRAGEIVVPGNLSETVYSTFIFSASNEALENLFNLSKNLKVYNTSDGMRIRGATPLPIEDVLVVKNKSSKKDLIDFIKNELFITYEFDKDSYESFLDFDCFEKICNELINFIDLEFTDRKSASDALRNQYRYLETFNFSTTVHLFKLLDGSLIYAHTVLRLCLFTFDSEEETMSLFNLNKNLLISYLKAAVLKYKNVLNEVDRQRTKTMQLFKN